ncbi:cholesteryl ester transfer protein isoform X2 [Trichechus manatus latirostris]|uniref:Cholesteryl ester transfer protein n=1 Tax=Trichechus manatus latirostris TaxID=127582 RepID=A0A2Y9FYA2_TRIMA|nr:cholesteryl ester transfer protein isoform X2 [Trichechus manatus latirostris]
MLAATLLALALALLGNAHACSKSTSYEAGIVCRITQPATLVLNQETTKVIQTAFQRASYPDIKGEKAMMFLGQVKYGLHNIQISHLSIASSQVELVEDKSIDISIQNVSVIFKGTLNYGYTGAWGLGVDQSVDFEIDSSIDLQINTELTCDSGRVRANALDCYLSFHKLLLHLHGKREPGWIKHLFINFISFTLKLVLKGQVCKQIDVIANIMADFVQKKAADFLSDTDTQVDISLTGPPVIKATYLESHHKAMLETQGLNTNQDIFQELFSGFPTSQAQVTVHCVKTPRISCQNQGVVVSSSVMVKFLIPHPGRQLFVAYAFEEDIITTIQASYSKKKLFLSLLDFQIKPKTVSNLNESSESVQSFLRSMITTVGIPEVMSRLEVVLTAFMNSKGLDLFEIINPEIITRDGYLLLQMDFGFPEHLLVDFLQRLT